MATFYFEYDRRKHFSAPQYSRVRHRFRGPRESEKVNQEITQFSFSVHKLYEIYEGFQEGFVENANLILEGGASGVNDSENNPLDLLGLQYLAARLDQAARRVRALEA